MYYQINKAAARTINREPTMTDQSQADDTDLNLIVRKFMSSGQAPGAGGQPMYGDFTELPRDLRAMIEHARTLDALHADLPVQLREYTLEQMFELTNEDILRIMQPPATPPATQPPEET